MNADVAAKRAQVADLCRRTGVKRLDVFGSATGDTFDDDSDVDVLVEFDSAPGFDAFGAYFDLKEGLEAIFGRSVDIVTPRGMENPYFRERVNSTKELLYAA